MNTLDSRSTSLFWALGEVGNVGRYRRVAPTLIGIEETGKLMEPIDFEDLKGMTCPICNRKMSHGYIAGHWVRLRWTDKEKTKTIFSGTPLRKKLDWWNAPNLEAVRCEVCKIGVFRYDY